MQRRLRHNGVILPVAKIHWQKGQYTMPQHASRISTTLQTKLLRSETALFRAMHTDIDFCIFNGYLVMMRTKLVWKKLIKGHKFQTKKGKQ